MKWTGVGLGNGRQKFGFLPAPHTDSIFAVIGEEMGIIGAAVVVILYVVLVIRGFQIARRSVDSFGGLLAAGLTVWIAAKALLNIAVMTAVVPSTGTPLPFISYGGSSLVVLMAGAGLLLSVGRVRAKMTGKCQNGEGDLRIMIAAGGTGGHVYPALAVAEALVKDYPQVAAVLCRQSWSGARSGSRNRTCHLRPMMMCVPGQLPGSSWGRRLVSLMNYAIGVVQSIILMLRYRPQALLLTGGWSGLPVALVAWLWRVPMLIFLPDIEPGSTIRLLMAFGGQRSA